MGLVARPAAVERESLEESEPSESEAKLPAFPDLGSALIRVIFLLRGRPFNFGAVITNKPNSTVILGKMAQHAPLLALFMAKLKGK